MPKNITITESQYNRIIKNPKKNVIISESQLDVIREFENHKVLHDEFENKVRSYMEQLFTNPCKPKYDEFFDIHDIPEDILQNKMLDLGLIKKTEKIDEPENADGKKHSMHSVKYIFSNNNFNDKIDKLYDSFFVNGERKSLNECDGGGFAAPSSGGATNAEGVGGQYEVPFGLMRRGFGVSGNTVNQVDMEPSLKRDNKKGIAINQV